jgi:hypothetical protein
MLGELAIATRSDPQQPDERAPHHVEAAESSRRGHVLEASIRAFELTTRRLHAHLKHVLGRRRADLSSEYALEVSNAHRHPIREVVHRQSRLEMLGDPDLQGETLWYRMVVGGTAPRYVRLRPRPSLSAILDGRSEQALPDGVNQLIAKTTVEILNLRPTMCYGLSPARQ